MHVNPYLHFNGDCQEAFQFYARALGGTIEMMKDHSGIPDSVPMPAAWRDKILHARLRAGGCLLMGSDAPPDRYRRPQGFAITLNVDTPEDAERYYAALSPGGTVEMAMQETFFARRFAMFTDRFGVPWMISCATEENRV